MYCTSCGKKINDGDAFCSFCGAPQKTEARQAAQKISAAAASRIELEQKRSKKTLGLIAAITAVIVIAVLAVIIIPGISSGSTNTANTVNSGNTNNKAAGGNNNNNMSGNTGNNTVSGNLADNKNNGADNTGNNGNATDNSPGNSDPKNNTNNADNGNSGSNTGSNAENSNTGSNAGNNTGSNTGNDDLGSNDSGNYLFKEDHYIFGNELLQGAAEPSGTMIGKDRIVKKLPFAVDEFSRTMSADGSRGLIYANGDIYYIEPGKELASVGSGMSFLNISSNGKTVLLLDQEQGYIELHSAGDPIIKLMVKRYAAGGKIEDVDSGYCFWTSAVSPSGSAFVYTVETTDKGLVTRLYVNGKIKDLPVVLKYITSVSDDGSLIYFLDEDFRSFNAYKDGKVIKVHSATGVYSMYDVPRYYNYDCTQVCFEESGGFYISDRGSEAEKICSFDPETSSLQLVLPYNTQSYMKNIDYYDIICGVRLFKGCYFTRYEKNSMILLYLDDTFTMHTVAERVDQCGMASDGKTVVYLKNGDIYQTSYTKSGSETKTLAETSAKRFQMSADGKTIYYLLEDINDLYVMTNGKKPRLLAQNVTSFLDHYYDPFQCIAEGNKLLYVSDGSLYITDGKETSEVKGYQGEVNYIFCNACNAAFSTNVTGNSSFWPKYICVDSKALQYSSY